jgi:hypothetical protein
MAGGKDQGQVSNILNATLPTATGGKPTAFTNLVTTTAMLIRLDSTLASASAAGTQLSGTGYTSGGAALGASTPSSAGSAVTLPLATTSWTNGSGSSWTIDSLDITDSAATRTWWGPWNGEPISVANGNTFQVAAAAISASDS